MTIWFTSDLHFNHDKEFIWKARGFNSIDEMNEVLIKRFNSKVAEDDDVYILGDLCLGGPDRNYENSQLIERLNGEIHIILGNHDTSNRQYMYAFCENIHSSKYADILKVGKYHFYLSHFPTITSNIDDGKKLKERTLNLYGHTHQKDKFYNECPFMYNVGVDAHDGYPISIDEIIKEMKENYNQEE